MSISDGAGAPGAPGEPGPSESRPGRAIVVASWASNALFAALALPAAGGVDGLDRAATGVALGLFAVSIVVWSWAFGRAVVRSARGDDIAVASLFFLQGSAPRAVKAHLLGALAVSVAVAVVTAAADPFGVMVPMLPLGLAGLWAARHGTFPPRPQPASAARPGSGVSSGSGRRRVAERSAGPRGRGPASGDGGSGREAVRSGVSAPAESGVASTRSRAAKGAARGRSSRGRPSQ
ncbi:MAG: hypothetical protein IT197_03435 [Acidimicrobiia bacterium]|nr:hypothetical protein [Acidimicrobiia bacterium]